MSTEIKETIVVGDNKYMIWPVFRGELPAPNNPDNWNHTEIYVRNLANNKQTKFHYWTVQSKQTITESKELMDAFEDCVYNGLLGYKTLKDYAIAENYSIEEIEDCMRNFKVHKNLSLKFDRIDINRDELKRINRYLKNSTGE
jgi:hypothetical protein